MALKSVLKELAATYGAAAFCRKRTANRSRILMYHRFPTESLDGLARQCEHLRRNYDVTSLSEIAAYARTKKPVAGRPLAVTVDDGYADFDAAWRIFRSHAIPVTFFVTSGFLDRDLWLWPDIVKFSLTHSKSVAVEIDSVRYALVTSEDKRRSFDRICERLIDSSNDYRVETLRRLPELCGVTLPPEQAVEDSALSWDRLRQMAAEGLDVGSHTRTHPLLSRLPHRDAVYQEISGSCDRIALQIGMSVGNFCYPNGKAADYDETTRGVVRELGLNAVNAIRGLVADGADPVDLHRIAVDPWMKWGTFQLEAAGYKMSRL